MKNNLINLRLLCALSSILLVSNGLQAMQAMTEVEKNLAKLLKPRSCKNCNLQGVHLVGTHLDDVNLKGANLKGANINNAQLFQANLNNANLEGANLEGANLQDANLKKVKGITDKEIITSGAKLNENTILPSGKKYSN